MDSGVLDDEVVSMIDVLHEDNELEAEADAVLGDSDDQQCTYQSGYARRQALYACSTCTPPSGDPAGVCLACSLMCHDGHELFELYTKRNFRCDCGNEIFGEFKCKLNAEKEPRNENNQYNQNFKGTYCTCMRPYPDSEDEIEDEMIQCVMCEDWYHSRHLGQLPPAEYQEMICDQCVTRCSFLQAYLSVAVPGESILPGPSQVVITNAETDKNVDVCTIEADSSTDKKESDKPSDETTQNEKPDALNDKPEALNDKPDTQTNSETLGNGCDTSSDKVKEPTVSSSSSNQVVQREANGSKDSVDTEEPSTSSEKGDCKFKVLEACIEKVQNVAAFFMTGWRAQLCTCESCKEMYNSLNVSFLLDESDTVVAYEERGIQRKAARGNAYDEGIRAVNQMDRVKQMEVITEYNDMKTELTEYLRQFAAEGKVVTRDNITEFFENMRERKRQRVGDENTMQYFCR